MYFSLKYRVLVVFVFMTLSGTAQFEPFFGADETIELVRREETFFRKGEKEIYDTSQVLIAKGKILIGQEHGKWKEFDAESGWHIVHYKYGVRKSDLITSSGKRAKLLLLVGKPIFFRKCQEGTNTFKLHMQTVAGCRVNIKIMFRVGWHNFFVKASLVLKHGFDWEEKYREMCRPLKQ